MQHCRWPISCCCFTTAIGLLSLLLSSSQPVRQFGLFGALSIACATALLLLFLPPFLTWVGHARVCIAAPPTTNPGQSDSRTSDGWSRLAKFTNKFCWPIAVVCSAILIGCALGIPRVKTGSHLQNFFPAGHEVLVNAKEVEKQVGPLGSIELLLHSKNPDRLNNRLKVQGIDCLLYTSPSPRDRG